MKTMTVTAAPGIRVPMEGAARRYITDAAPVNVPESAYYLRRLADGDLTLAPEPAAKPRATAKETDNG